jgi:hypothetical protein
LEEITEKFMEKILDMVNQNVQDALNQMGIQDGTQVIEAESLSSETAKTSLKCWSHTWVIWAASSQNNNCHNTRCRKKFKD